MHVELGLVTPHGFGQYVTCGFDRGVISDLDLRYQKSYLIMHNHIRFDIVISCNKLQQTLLFSVYLILNFFILKSDAIAICFQLGKICNSIHFFVFLYVYII